MTDRVPGTGKENRKKLTLEGASSLATLADVINFLKNDFYGKIEFADEPTESGTPLSKANLLSDTTAALLGLTGDPTVNDALAAAPYVTGTYTGDGNASQASQDVALPFTPSAVIVFPQYFTYADTNAGDFGMALNGYPQESVSPNTTILIGTNKFTVYYNASNLQLTNTNGKTYKYIAFR